MSFLTPLLDQRDTVGFLREAFHESEVRLVFSERAFWIGQFDGLGQIKAGNGIVRSKDDGLFKRCLGSCLVTQFSCVESRLFRISGVLGLIANDWSISALAFSYCPVRTTTAQACGALQPSQTLLVNPLAMDLR